MSYSGSNVPAAAINPMIESPYIPSTESTVSGRSSSPEHLGERVADSSMPQHTSLAMQYVNHANMPTAGYVYTEHRLHGVTDVDVDEKPHLVYETMTDLQNARQRMVMNGGHPGLASNHVDGVKCAGIPNKPAKQRGARATMCLIKFIWNIFLLIVVVGAFSLSVYNFLNNNSTSTAPSTEASTELPVPVTDSITGEEEDMGVSFAEYNRTVTELRAELERLSSQHESRYQQLNATISSLFIGSLPPVSPGNQLDLTAGCLSEVSTCPIDHNNAGTPPTSLTCETPERTLEEDGFRNVNIYCSIDNSAGEVNPITSTLNIYNGEVSCLCNLIILTAPTASPLCRLIVQRCPETIRLNTTSM